MKKTISSPVFGVEFNTEVLHNVHIVKHRELEEFLRQYGFQKNVVLLSTKVAHSVAVCTIYTSEGNISEVGETTPETLSGESRQYPATVAWNRAVDRATIKLLGFTEVVMSDEELDVTTETDIPSPNPSVSIKETPEEKGEVAETVTIKTLDVTDDEIISFGRFTGKTLREAKALPGYKEYCKWLVDEEVSFAEPKMNALVAFMKKSA